jgi:hypothetical protein
VRQQPSIFNVSVQDHLEPNIAWLETRLQLVDDQDSLQKVLRLTPVYCLLQLLGTTKMEETLEPTLVWLQEKLNLGVDGIVQLVLKESSFLGFSLEIHKERVAWLQKRLALEDTSLRKASKSMTRI